MMQAPLSQIGITKYISMSKKSNLEVRNARFDWSLTDKLDMFGPPTPNID